MRRVATIAVLVILSTCALSLWAGLIPNETTSSPPTADAVRTAQNVAGTAGRTNPQIRLSATERMRMTESEHLQWLEKNGELPGDGDKAELLLAGRTSWWGKRLDPKEFWKGRVVWLDVSATRTAQSHGRFFPPVPYEDPSVREISDADEGFAAPYLADPFRLYGSQREVVFWDRFAKSHPAPPEEIEKEQWTWVFNFCHVRSLMHKLEPPTGKEAEEIPQMPGREPLKPVYPTEAFTGGVLF